MPDIPRTAPAGASRNLAIEGHSIDYIPENQRHARLSNQGYFWFLGNFHFFTCYRRCKTDPLTPK